MAAAIGSLLRGYYAVMYLLIGYTKLTADLLLRIEMKFFNHVSLYSIISGMLHCFVAT